MTEEQDRNDLFKKNKAYTPDDPALSAPGAQEASRYNASEQQMLTQAKQKNKDTTALALEALKVVQQTEDVATGTVEELGRQDAQLDKVQKDYENIEADLQESKQAISYMDRCCCCFCFACCCDCDDNAKADKTRRQRVKARSEITKSEKEMAELQAKDKTQKQLQAARGASGTKEDADRDALMGRVQNNKQADNPALRIGEGLEDGDRQEIQDEIRVQEDALDQIDKHLENIKAMAEGMHETLVGQDGKIDTIANAGEKTDMELKAQGKVMKKLK